MHKKDGSLYYKQLLWMIETMELKLVPYNHYNKYAIQIIEFFSIQKYKNISREISITTSSK